MRIRFISVFTLLVFFAACRYSPTDSTGGTGNNNGGDTRTSTLRGTLTLEGREDSVHKDHSGARIDLLGTSLFGISDRNGAFAVPGVQPGSYIVIASAPGYDSVVVGAYTILPPAGSVIYLGMLKKSIPTKITLDSASYAGFYQMVYLTLDRTKFSQSEFVFFFGRTPAVSGAWDDWVQYASPEMIFTGTGPNIVGVRIAPSWLSEPGVPGKTGFKSGDSVYVVAYTGSNGPLIPDPTSLKYRHVNLANRSNVIGFVMP